VQNARPVLMPHLCAAADELEASVAREAALQAQMCDAIRAAEAEAQRQVEDSYQEASFAGMCGMWMYVLCGAEGAERLSARECKVEGCKAASK
jgi:hypothetical protein